MIKFKNVIFFNDLARNLFSLLFLITTIVCVASATDFASAATVQKQESSTDNKPIEKETITSKQEKQDNSKKSDSGASNTSADDEATDGSASENNQEAETNAEEKNPRPKFAKSKSRIIDKSKTLELTFDDIAFDMEKGDDFKRSMLTEDIKNLDQQKVRLRGFIRPSVKQTGLTKFVFVRDNKECCFGPGAAIFDCVLVELDKGEKTDFTVRPVTIEGEFFLKEFKGLNGKIWAIYRMRNGVVK